MAKRTLIEHERLVAAIIGQTLYAMTETKLTVAEIIDAAAESARQRTNEATTERWT